MQAASDDTTDNRVVWTCCKNNDGDRFSGYARGPFLIMPNYVDGRQLVLQTIFIAVLFALVVNIPWPRRKKDDTD